MPPRVWPAHELVEALTGPGEPEVAGELVVLGPSAGLPSPEQIAAALERLATLPGVVVGQPGWVPPTELVDLAVGAVSYTHLTLPTSDLV